MLPLLTSHQLKVYELQYLETEGPSLHAFSSLQTVPSALGDSAQTATNPLLHRLITHNLRSFAGCGRNGLLGYGYLLLCRLYGGRLNESLLVQVKSALYSEEVDLRGVGGEWLSTLTNADMKRFFIEFLFQLSFAEGAPALDKKLDKYPVILHILAAFLHCLLQRLGEDEGADSGEGLEQLNDYFDINCRRVDSLFLFFQEGLFLYLDERLAFAGAYSEKVRSSKRTSLKGRKNSSSSREASSQEKSNLFETRVKSYHIEDTVRESNYFDIDAPTPFFNLGSEQNQETIRDSFKICDNVLELNNYLSVPNLRPPQENNPEQLRNIGRYEQKDQQLEQREERHGREEREKAEGLKVTARGKVYKTPNFLKKLNMMKTIHFDDDQSDDGSYLTEEKLLFQMERGQCLCHPPKASRNALCSKLYEINIFNYPHKETVPTETGLNMLSTRSSLIFSSKDYVPTRNCTQRPRLPNHTVRTERSSDEKVMNGSYESFYEGYPLLDNSLNSMSEANYMWSHSGGLALGSRVRPRVNFHYLSRRAP